SVGIVRPSHNHMAKGNTIRNNVFLSDTDLHITFARSSGYIFERNVLLAAERILIDSPDRMAARNNNCFFSRTGKIEANNLNDYASTGVSKMQPGPGDKFEDPKIIEFDTGAVVFAPDSPIRDLGIKPINVSDAGPRP
ncbi:MAG: hypothetical protein JW720_10200, partial [Sedimentisphaerales bacterium]|nr:hypothetical protein [Sedimentisphaerales bacterium]